MSLYLVKLFETVDNDTANPLVSTFTYLSNSLLPSSAEAVVLADAFYELFFVTYTSLASLMHPACNWNFIEVTSPYNPTVLASRTMDIDGSAAGARLPKFIALEWISPRTRTDIRSGFKRFGVTTEAMVEAEALQGVAITLADEVSEALSTPLDTTTGGSVYEATPVIVKRIKYTAPSGNDAYRLPNSPAELQYSQAQNWSIWRVSTQSSRKR